MARERRRGAVIGVRTVAALTAGMTVGYLAGDLLPEIVDGLQDDRGMSETAAGALVTAILLAAAVAGFVFARRADRAGRVRTAMVGGGLTVGGYAVAALAPSGFLLAAAGIVAGLGAGIVLAAGTAAISATSDPDRASGATVLVNGVVGAVLLFLLPQITDGEVTPILLVLAGVGVVAMPMLRWLPEGAVPAGPRARGPLPALAVGGALFAGTVWESWPGCCWARRPWRWIGGRRPSGRAFLSSVGACWAPRHGPLWARSPSSPARCWCGASRSSPGPGGSASSWRSARAR